MKKIFRLPVPYYRSVCITALICISFYASGQDSTLIGSYSLKQDERIAVLMGKYKTYNKEVDFTDGYRVQIMFTDVREDVYKSKAQLYKQFPELRSYVEYEQPYYKLRIGDFRSRLDATHYLQQIIPLYGSAFIVKDKVKIK